MPVEPARFVLTLSCEDRRGIVAAVANCIASQDCNIVESAQYGDPDSGRFFMRVAFAAPASTTVESFSRGFLPVATGYNFVWELHDLAVKPRVMILVSKMGHCLNDLLYRNSIGQLPMELASVVSNHETMRRRVEAEGLPYHYLPVVADDKEGQERRLLDLIEAERIDLVVLARYMQVLSSDLSKRLAGRVINIHHSFLPSFKGAKPYHRAHERGVKLIGATAHYVTAELDEGPIIEQDVGRVDHSMSAEELIAIGRDIENAVLARAIKFHLEHRVLLNGTRTVIFR
ncbi:formyltetrahydrofolate deformylase [Kaistia dalseonensis]|uniref:Formyltetrahydrofolate deformylase n=1 Tax=Kaistia dalseonensis TaxID=410840 RepID=A0ABU0HB49_9HYPH|nr:formyltetrahydrofolate deformylase [Kaistia dalseonensis]MCX5496914.1 formyltetrahydrofolate deformylase [Kaistia dalseonensis]MDQ0439539.1 formyltetrahydrofolate deformylase [Kaistia dalseonensis]